MSIIRNKQASYSELEALLGKRVSLHFIQSAEDLMHAHMCGMVAGKYVSRKISKDDYEKQTEDVWAEWKEYENEPKDKRWKRAYAFLLAHTLSAEIKCKLDLKRWRFEYTKCMALQSQFEKIGSTRSKKLTSVAV